MKKEERQTQIAKEIHELEDAINEKIKIALSLDLNVMAISHLPGHSIKVIIKKEQVL